MIVRHYFIQIVTTFQKIINSFSCLTNNMWKARFQHRHYYE